MKTLFISRKIEVQHKLRSLIQQNAWTLIDLPMISFKAMPFQLTDVAYDVLFFTSPRSFQYFFDKHPEIVKHTSLACIGKSTQQYIEKKELHLDFVGENETLPEEVAIGFARWLGERSVLMPQSNRSNQSISSKLETSQCTNIVVYETLLCPQKLDCYPDVIIFSSPSNAEAYLLANTIKPTQVVWSWGSTTKSYLDTRGISNSILNNFEELVG